MLSLAKFISLYAHVAHIHTRNMHITAILKMQGQQNEIAERDRVGKNKEAESQMENVAN